MDKITTTTYCDNLLVLGFDGNIYKNENKSWTLFKKRDLTKLLENLYENRHTFKLFELRDKIIDTVDTNLEDVNIHYFGANQYYEISKMVIALEILKSYNYDPFEYLGLPLDLGQKETDLEKLLFSLKYEEINSMTELYDISEAYIGLSNTGIIEYKNHELKETQIVYAPEQPITYEEYINTNGVALYDCFIEFLERNQELDPETKVRIRSYSFGPDSDSSYIVSEEFFEDSRTMITVPRYCLPEQHQLYFIKHNTQKILEVIDSLKDIETIEQYIKHHLDNGQGLYSILKQIMSLVWPNNTLEIVMSSLNSEYDYNEYPGVPKGNLDMMNKNNMYGLIIYCLLEYGICLKVETFATYCY